MKGQKRELANIRRRLGLSQKAFAAKVGCKGSCISMIEKGERLSSYELMCRIEDFLGMSHRDFLKFSTDSEESQVDDNKKAKGKAKNADK